MAGRPHRINESLIEPEARRAQRRKHKFLEFTHSSTRATMLMVAAALLAFAIENTPALPYFNSLWHDVHLGFTIGAFSPEISLGHFINDFLMALFFLMVGLEIKYAMTAGELTEPRKAILPIVAAAGGALMPALVYLALNWGGEFQGGWGVPMANDIAFCLGILALLGTRVPLGLRAFLSTLTIADDIIAILVIAVFYTSSLDVWWLAAALACFAVLLVLNRLHVYDLAPYMLVARDSREVRSAFGSRWRMVRREGLHGGGTLRPWRAGHRPEGVLARGRENPPRLTHDHSAGHAA